MTSKRNARSGRSRAPVRSTTAADRGQRRRRTHQRVVMVILVAMVAAMVLATVRP